MHIIEDINKIINKVFHLHDAKHAKEMKRLKIIADQHDEWDPIIKSDKKASSIRFGQPDFHDVL